MPMRTHRHAELQAPKDAVLQAVEAYLRNEVHASEIEVTPEDATVRMRRVGGTKRALFTATETTLGTRLQVEYDVDRGGYNGMADVFDLYGREAEKWLYGVWRQLGRMYAAHPWPMGHAPTPPEGTAPPHFEPGAAVVALASDGNTYLGTVRRAEGDRYVVGFENGVEQSIDAHDVHPAPAATGMT